MKKLVREAPFKKTRHFCPGLHRQPIDIFSFLSIWYSILKKNCDNIIEYMKYKWALYINYKGQGLDNELLRKFRKKIEISILKSEKMVYWQVIMINICRN